MPTTQTNGTDTATFERRDNAESQYSPPVAGGQGREVEDVETTVDVLLLLAVVALFGVIVRVVGLLLIGG